MPGVCTADHRRLLLWGAGSLEGKGPLLMALPETSCVAQGPRCQLRGPRRGGHVTVWPHSAMLDLGYVYTVHYGSQQPHVALVLLRCGRGDGGTEFVV